MLTKLTIVNTCFQEKITVLVKMLEKRKIYHASKPSPTDWALTLHAVFGCCLQEKWGDCRHKTSGTPQVHQLMLNRHTLFTLFWFSILDTGSWNNFFFWFRDTSVCLKINTFSSDLIWFFFFLIEFYLHRLP